MNLTEAICKYKHQIHDLDLDFLAGNLKSQEEAFYYSRLFLDGIRPGGRFNHGWHSYHLKHVIESPQTYATGEPSRLEFPPAKIYTVYVYEGTAILAALACGFGVRQPNPRLLGSYFNFNNASMNKKLAAIRESAAFYQHYFARRASSRENLL